MTCQDARRLVNAYVDNELDLVRTVELDEHVKGCPTCSRIAAEHTELRRSMQSKELYWEAPAGLEARVRSRVVGSGARESAGSGWWARMRVPSLVGAGVLVVALAVVLAVLITRPGHDDVLAQQVVASHIRSLQATHLTDVVSTDQHTVKPWFSGKLDFSPSVQDLAASGFPLAGGRLDYLDGRPVAALVYTRRLHRINVFEWPGGGNQSAPRVRTINGYNVIQWSEPQMKEWAVSDLNAQELMQFVNQLRNAR